MIRVHLSRLMGEKRLKIADLVRDTGLSRTTLTRLFYEDSERLDFDTLEKVCRYLEVEVGDLLEIVDDGSTTRRK
jgi:putative transcriptional regulator